MTRKTITTIVLAVGLLNASAQIQWPAISEQTKPWARWWWQGSAVDKKNLTANLEIIKPQA